MTARTLAFSDIHGCLQTFIHLFENIVQPTKEDKLYFLGDYIDRGPDSKGVIDYIMQLKTDGYEVVTLKGNHEEILQNTLTDPLLLNNWVKFGGHECLKSFGVNHPSDIPKVYFDFIEDLEFYAETEEAFLAHAGFDFNSPDPFNDKEAMLWIRDMQINEGLTKGKPVIHGHTPVTLTETQRQLADHSLDICIDTGCVFDWKDGKKMGILTAIDIRTKELYYCENRE